ncbi:MAG: DUF2922 domain-containing protein [Peptococcaceae bacterium]|nr:DUF2922 domain-containing protein [Peptococcaceae bacterium]
MAEKKLVMRFTTNGGKETTMTLSGVKQDMDSATVQTAMQAMVDSNAFATTKGEAYRGVLGAAYVEEVETVLFDNEETGV